MPEQTEDTPSTAIDWLRVKSDSTANEAVRKNQRQALDSFSRFLGTTPISFGDINLTLISEWMSWLFSQGYTPATVATYLSRFSALYGKAVGEGIAPATEAFSTLKEKLASASPESIRINAIDDCLGRLRHLVLTNCSGIPARQLAKDSFLFSIYNGGMTFSDVAAYRKDSYQGDDDAILDIVGRYSKPKNKYLFPLRQSERTPRQLDRAVESLFSEALKTAGIRIPNPTPSTAADLWASAAMRCGIAAPEIAAIAGNTETVNPIYSFATSKQLTEEDKRRILHAVSRIISRDPEDWYAMQFRPFVRYEEVDARLRNAGISFSEIFYPMEEIYRQVGKKMVRRERPVVPGLLFFRSKATQLPGLYRKIGDLAWGYRQTRESGSPYAVISRRAIECYRNTIGQFTEGMEILPEGTIELQPGDRVEIIGGEFMGRTATFEKVLNPTRESSAKEADETSGQKPNRIIYRLRLLGDNNIEWVVNLDPRLVTPAHIAGV